MFANARRALSGSDTPVAPGVWAATLLAWAWQSIDRYPEYAANAPLNESTAAGHRELMQWAVIKALDQCVEDDGHLVCCNGIAQRITFALAGYVEGILRQDEVSGVAVFNIEIEIFREQLRQEALAAGVVLAPLPANAVFPDPGLETPEATPAQFEAWMARMRETFEELDGPRQRDFLSATRAAVGSFSAWADYAARHPDFPGER